ncbi:MAG: hypothetical protein CMJ31_11375, partial [Phycisphaerae bacterium]|nr:hypothetical protein [Phycisphaerae bacterium]
GNPAGQLLSGGTRALGGTTDDPAFALDDNDAHSIELVIAARFDTKLGRMVNDIELYLDGLLATAGVDSGDGMGDDTPLASTFNQISVGTNSLAFLDWRIDNVEVDTNVGPCEADLTGDGAADAFDVIAFASLFNAGDMAADVNGDEMLTEADYVAFLMLAEAGCP